MSDWYYSLLGEEFGPVSVATLHELLQDGTLAGSDPVRRSDAAEPITGTEFQRLNPLTANLPPESSEDEAADADEPCDLFWFQVEGITLGPVSGHSLIKLAEIGRISADTLIRRDNEFLWEAASEFHELSIVFMLSQPDIPAKAVPAGQSNPEQPIHSESESEDSESDGDNGKSAAKPGKRSSAGTPRGAKAPVAAGRGQRSGPGSRKLVNRRRQAEAAAKAEAEDAMLQEIFAELE
ncbi:MAG: GYF domain-containing protein, partial [Planctomycetaceae bacterium]